jgi:hypothetical protein
MCVWWELRQKASVNTAAIPTTGNGHATADFSMFRVYADKDGNPAEYSESNVPLKPKHYLPVNLGGVKRTTSQ